MRPSEVAQSKKAQIIMALSVCFLLKHIRKMALHLYVLMAIGCFVFSWAPDWSVPVAAVI